MNHRRRLTRLSGAVTVISRFRSSVIVNQPPGESLLQTSVRSRLDSLSSECGA
jgi:hypothetical protein